MLKLTEASLLPSPVVAFARQGLSTRRDSGPAVTVPFYRPEPASVAIPLWSISVEEQFYLVWPLILRRMSRMRIIYAALAVLGLGNIARIALVYTHASGAAAEYNTFVRIDPIAFGILIACLFGERSPRLGLAGRLALFSVS
jgi:peptidoglycan/LPS O-acetylase OafA/YrhL